jgi:hypothetical protein
MGYSHKLFLKASLELRALSTWVLESGIALGMEVIVLRLQLGFFENL